MSHEDCWSGDGERRPYPQKMCGTPQSLTKSLRMSCDPHDARLPHVQFGLVHSCYLMVIPQTSGRNQLKNYPFRVWSHVNSTWTDGSALLGLQAVKLIWADWTRNQINASGQPNSVDGSWLVALMLQTPESQQEGIERKWGAMDTADHFSVLAFVRHFSTVENPSLKTHAGETLMESTHMGQVWAKTPRQVSMAGLASNRLKVEGYRK